MADGVDGDDDNGEDHADDDDDVNNVRFSPKHKA